MGSNDAGVSPVMSLVISSSRYPTARSAAIFAIGNPVAFDASALERETRGFISISTCRPVCGSTANCTFDPPVSTPITRRTFSAASRICWYSRSVRVCWGATVMESPVWIPIGSTFSIEQMITPLSSASRITSNSNSFQPAIDSSIKISLTGLISRLRAARPASSSGFSANPLPPPPSVKDARTITGYPIASPRDIASSRVCATPARGTSRPALVMASLNPLRSSARWIASREAPISRIPSRSRSPDSARATATLSAVCPPIVGSSASGRSRSRIRTTESGSRGSMYVRSANCGSVMIVAGLEFTSATS